MGTRNLTIVYLDGEYKVAQYGQWDGYPEGNGLKVLHFLKDMDEKKFRAAVRNTSFADPKKLDTLWKKYGAVGGVISVEDARKFGEAYPQFYRDTGPEILSIIMKHTEGIELQDDLTFAADGLYCEWAWVIDLDKRTFEGYKGFGSEPLTEQDRFYFLRDLEENGYSGVRLVAEWSIDELPSDEDFLAAFKEGDEE